MSAVTGDGADLESGLSALSQRFSRVSARMAEAGQALIDHRSLPDESLFQEIVAVRDEFDGLRARTLEAAASLTLQLAAPIGELAELDAAVRSVLAESAVRARRAADEQAARRRAEEEAKRRAEDQARQKAEEEARRKTDEDAKRKAEAEAKRRAEEEARRKAEEEAGRRAEEQARQKVAEEARRKAEEDAKRKAAAEAKRKAEDEARQSTEAGAKRKADEEARHKAEEDAKRTAAEDAKRKAEAEAEAKRKAAEESKRKAAEEEATRKAAEEEATRKAEADATHKAADDAHGPTDGAEATRTSDADAKRRIEEARRKLEEIRRRDPAPAAVVGAGGEGGLETAQWWVSASAAWGNLKSRQVRFADGVRDVLGKYPYVFSVPVQASADYEDGLLAYGFAVLLEHVDQQAPGFVSEALSRLPARKGATVGRRLYDYLATPLKTRYPDFVKAVMEAGLPKPGLWVSGGIDETETETTVFQRPSAQIGDANQKAERITQDRLRFVDHHFSVAIAPLTARFVRVEAKGMKESRDVEIRMSERGVPSDQAWIGVLGPRDFTPRTRRHDRQGSLVTGLGLDAASVWVGLFNADPDAEKRVELAVTLRRKAQAAALSHFRKR